MTDPRIRYFRTVRRLRRSARRWSVLAGGLGGAAAIIVPSDGISQADAWWAAAAGATTALACWRWSDLRALGRQPAPPPPDSVIAAARTWARMVATVERLPVGRAALGEVRRQQSRLAVRGSAAAGPWKRLDQASMTLAGLSQRLTGPGQSAILDAAVAERSLRDLAHRVASVEKAMRFAPDDSRSALSDSNRMLAERLDTGVAAYERLVSAAASYVAEDGRSAIEDPSIIRLTEASDLLRGVAAGLAELRGDSRPAENVPRI